MYYSNEANLNEPLSDVKCVEPLSIQPRGGGVLSQPPRGSSVSHPGVARTDYSAPAPLQKSIVATRVPPSTNPQALPESDTRRSFATSPVGVGVRCRVMIHTCARGGIPGAWLHLPLAGINKISINQP